MGWRDIEICRKDTGEPFVVLHGAALDFAEKLGVATPLVSLSHSDNYSVANAVVTAA
jgi:phosphopantetheinyl transferase (holo-ACP synthase)